VKRWPDLLMISNPAVEFIWKGLGESSILFDGHLRLNWRVLDLDPVGRETGG